MCPLTVNLFDTSVNLVDKGLDPFTLGCQQAFFVKNKSSSDMIHPIKNPY
ncbi:hypothetical protein LMG8526_1330 [Lactococcus lactis subsp. lactis]|nr:hypothetical protein LMG8526_1330 [Lactococcus lactis subsp. lactis]